MTVSARLWCALLLLAVLIVATLPSVAADAEAPTFSHDTATRLSLFNRAVGCRAERLIRWDCGEACSHAPDFALTALVENTTFGTRALVGVDYERQRVVVAFRGSDNVQNWIADFTFAPVPYTDGTCGDSCKVHRGFYATYQSVRDGVRAASWQSLHQNPTYAVYVTGHSLGGALATLCAADLAEWLPTQMNDAITITSSTSATPTADDTIEGGATPAHTFPASDRVVADLTEAIPAEDGDDTTTTSTEAAEDTTTTTTSTGAAEDTTTTTTSTGAAEDTTTTTSTEAAEDTTTTTTSTGAAEDTTTTTTSTGAAEDTTTTTTSTGAAEDTTTTTSTGAAEDTTTTTTSTGAAEDTTTTTSTGAAEDTTTTTSTGAAEDTTTTTSTEAATPTEPAATALEIQLYTFGSPRVGNGAFAGWVASLLPGHRQFRVTNGGDPIPHLPPRVFGFLHAPQEVWYAADGNTSQYTLCQDSNTTEDRTCSHCMNSADLHDHLDYMNMCSDCLCGGGDDGEEHNRPSTVLGWASYIYVLMDFLDSLF